MLIAIVHTIARDTMSDNPPDDKMWSNETASETVYSATVINAPALDRTARVNEMREKVAHVSLTQSPIVSEPSPETNDVVFDSLVNLQASEEWRCAAYRTFTGDWEAQGLQLEVVEGARLLYRTLVAPQITNASTSHEEFVTKEVIWQLPMQSLPGTNETCIDSDVIGVARDGSLIRNSEVKLYKVFGEETLIGYARDGFPIYGQTSNPSLDRCGGAVVDASYRYYISANETHILSCFSGVPVAIN